MKSAQSGGLVWQVFATCEVHCKVDYLGLDYIRPECASRCEVQLSSSIQSVLFFDLTMEIFASSVVGLLIASLCGDRRKVHQNVPDAVRLHSQCVGARYFNFREFIFAKLLSQTGASTTIMDR